jgi:hypothetical protein
MRRLIRIGLMTGTACERLRKSGESRKSGDGNKPEQNFSDVIRGASLT